MFSVYFLFCIFVSLGGLSIPTAVTLPAVGAICKYPQREGKAEGSLPFSDAFSVMPCGRKKGMSKFLFLSEPLDVTATPAKMKVSSRPEFFSAVKDLHNKDARDRPLQIPTRLAESC